jgi:ribonuclease III
MQKRSKRLAAALGYSFRDGKLLELALTHRSYAREKDIEGDNERLEFLGDAVLGLAVSEILMEAYPDYLEGRLTMIRSQLVSTENLYRAALELDLGKSIRFGLNEEKNGGRGKKSPLADAMEAVIAAVHLDGGFAAARSLIERWIASPSRIEEADKTLAHLNPKSVLQELLQSRQLPGPEYKIVGEQGPPHLRVFEVNLTVGEICSATGRGLTRRRAEQVAAAKALEAINLLPSQDPELPS